MINNLSDVFREAKTRLWDGESQQYLNGKWMEDYICHAIEDVTRQQFVLQDVAKEIIQSRLGYDDNGNNHTVNSYLTCVVGVSRRYLDANPTEVQKYRKDWLTSLEKEFKPKLKPKKGFAIHHIDGDKNNTDLSNLTYIKLK